MAVSLPLKSHIIGRVVALFVGFFGGSVAYTMFGGRLHAAGFEPFLMPVFVFGGAFLAQFAFGLVVPAQCPSCGADSAVPVGGKNLALYVCKACGAESNALQSVMAEQMAQMRAASAATAAQSTPAREEKTRSRMGWLFLVVGIGAIGIAVYLSDQSIRLVREGVSTDARVLRVTQEWSRGSKENELHHTAFIEYQVAGKPLTLQRTWSSSSGSFWTWPNYHQGEQLRVIYLPSDPSRASVHTVAELFFAPIFLTLFGLAFGAFGAAMIFYRRKPEEASDGTLVLGEQTQTQTQAGNFLKHAIGLGIFFAGAGVFYYFAVVRPDIERQRIEREAAARETADREARQEAARASAAAAAAAAARQATASAPVAAKPGMSECQLLLLDQRNQYAAKNPQYSLSFFNIRGPQGVECQECREQLASKLQSWAGFDVPGRGFPASGYQPGCVAFRQDIFGTAEGAKCIVAVLGSGFTADQSCSADGFPYTITYLLRK